MTHEKYGQRDQFLNPQDFDAARAREVAERLAVYHASESEVAQREAYLDLLGSARANTCWK